MNPTKNTKEIIHTIAVWKGATRPVITKAFYAPSYTYWVAWCSCGFRGREWKTERPAISEGQRHQVEAPKPVVASRESTYKPPKREKDEIDPNSGANLR